MTLSVHFETAHGCQGRQGGEQTVQTVSPGQSGKGGCKVPRQSEVKNSPTHKWQEVDKPLASVSMVTRAQNGARGKLHEWYLASTVNGKIMFKSPSVSGRASSAVLLPSHPHPSSSHIRLLCNSRVIIRPNSPCPRYRSPWKSLKGSNPV